MKTYTTMEYDTLNSVAYENNITAANLVAANKSTYGVLATLPATELLTPGMQLSIPQTQQELANLSSTTPPLEILGFKIDKKMMWILLGGTVAIGAYYTLKGK